MPPESDVQPAPIAGTSFEDDQRPAAPVDAPRDLGTIVLQGAVDASAVTRLREQIGEALDGRDRVVIDLHRVTVLGAPTLVLLCDALRRTHRQGATVVIAGAAPPAERVLELCELPGVELADSSGRVAR